MGVWHVYYIIGLLTGQITWSASWPYYLFLSPLCALVQTEGEVAPIIYERKYKYLSTRTFQDIFQNQECQKYGKRNHLPTSHPLILSYFNTNLLYIDLVHPISILDHNNFLLFKPPQSCLQLSLSLWTQKILFCSIALQIDPCMLLINPLDSFFFFNSSLILKPIILG